MISGYQIISLRNINIPIDGSAVKIAGIHNAIESNHRKPVLLSDIILDGVERSSRYVEFVVSGGSYMGYIAISDAGNLTITIDSADNVTINNG